MSLTQYPLLAQLRNGRQRVTKQAPPFVGVHAGIAPEGRSNPTCP